MTIAFIGPSYRLATRKADVQRSVNLFPVMNEVVGGKTGAYLQQIPGLDVFSEPVPVVSLFVVKTQESATVIVGGAQTYTLIATNFGPAAADGGIVTDDLPASFTFTSCGIVYEGGAAGPATATEAELLAGVAITTWPSGGTATFTIVGTLGTIGSIINTGTATIPPDTVGDGGSGSVTTTVDPLPPTGVYTTAGGVGTLDVGGTAELPLTPAVMVGDAMALFIMHRVGATFGAPPGWTVIGGGVADSSGSWVYLRAFGRIADGTANDAAPFTVTSGGTAWAMAALRPLNDAHFPSAFDGGDYSYGLESSGINSRPVTKANNTTQIAFSVGFMAAPPGGATFVAPPTGYTTISSQQFSFTSGTAFDAQLMATYDSSIVAATVNPGPFDDGNNGFGGGGAGALTFVVSWAP